jgi:hypothetical protein
MQLICHATGGHTEATFEKDEVRLSFHKTTPEEKGMIEVMVEKGKKAGMVLHTVDKKSELKPIEDEALLQEIFKGKGEIALKGTPESVRKLALDLLEQEIADGRKMVFQAQEDGTWKTIHKKEDFKPQADEKEVVSSKEKAGGG